MLGELIRRLRLRSGMSMEQVGTAVGVGRNAVWKWEKGSRVSSGRLSSVLDVLQASDEERLEALRLAKGGGARGAGETPVGPS
jgi:transcriptional regulator with XRE-family HTH domain